MAKIIRVLLLIIAVSSQLSAVSYEIFAHDKIIAIVNNEIITQKDLDDSINFMRVQLSNEYNGEQLEKKIQAMKSDLVQRLIEERLILQEAKKKNIKIDDSRIKAKINGLKKSYNSEREFLDALSEQGMVEADLETKTREQALMFSLIDSDVRSKLLVKPAEITDFYNKNSAEFTLPEQRDFQSLVVDNQSLAENIFNALEKGSQMNDLAKEYLLRLNSFSAFKGELKKDLEDVLFKLKIGEITKAVKIKDSFYIFKLNKINHSRQQTLAEAQDNIYNLLYETKLQEALAKWVDGLKESAYIKIVQE
jgi:parvulin-like peptidyl-prolyl isomerase